MHAALIPHTSGLPPHYPHTVLSHASSHTPHQWFALSLPPTHSVKPCSSYTPHNVTPTHGALIPTHTQCYPPPPPHIHSALIPHTMLPPAQYRRRDSDRSQYRSYLDYVREIGENMGFKVQEDTMRIPSSKRVSDEP